MNFGVGELDDQRHLRDFNLAFTCESGWWGSGGGGKTGKGREVGEETSFTTQV